jgi:hypothetical protein
MKSMLSFRFDDNYVSKHVKCCIEIINTSIHNEQNLFYV